MIDPKGSSYTADITVKLLTEVESWGTGEAPNLYRIYWIDEKAIQAIDDSDESALEIIKKHNIKEDMLCSGAEVNGEQLEFDMRVGDKQIQVDGYDWAPWGMHDPGIHTDQITQKTYLGADDDASAEAQVGKVVFGGIGPSSDPSDGHYLVIEKAPLLTMTMKVSIEVNSDEITAEDFSLYIVHLDDSSIYDSIFYRTTDIETDLRGIIYKGKTHELSVEYEAGPSTLEFYSPDLDGEWDHEPDVERQFLDRRENMEEESESGFIEEAGSIEGLHEKVMEIIDDYIDFEYSFPEAGRESEGNADRGDDLEIVYLRHEGFTVTIEKGYKQRGLNENGEPEYDMNYQDSTIQGNYSAYVLWLKHKWKDVYDEVFDVSGENDPSG